VAHLVSYPCVLLGVCASMPRPCAQLWRWSSGVYVPCLSFCFFLCCCGCVCMCRPCAQLWRWNWGVQPEAGWAAEAGRVKCNTHGQGGVAGDPGEAARGDEQGLQAWLNTQKGFPLTIDRLLPEMRDWNHILKDLGLLVEAIK